MEDLPDIRDSIMTRIWYVVKREGLTIPFPIAFEYGPGESPTPTPPTPAQLLGAYPRFKPALKHEDSVPMLKVYAAGECFGDQLTAGASVSDIGIIAVEDLKIMVFEDEVIGDLLNQSPVLADEIGDAIELRRQAAQSARRMKG